MLTDAKRVELILPILMALDVLVSGADTKDADYRDAESALHDALEEALSGCDNLKRGSLLRRSDRLYLKIFDKYRSDGAPVAKSGLVLYHILKELTDAEYLAVADGCAFGRALDRLLPALQHAAGDEKFYASAQKQARKALSDLRKAGYYQ